ncbi:AAA family ATPase [Candidatus Woesearchaeota archaeon]|nr:AAA family ATPase [Candidatus Woesearchaeota archaeon]
MSLVVITGTPGTGKSTLAKLLAKKFGFYRLDLHRHYQHLAERYDRKKRCYVLNKKRLEGLAIKINKQHPEGVIIDSHVAHLLPRKLVDLCVVLVCSDLPELQRRLKRRRYAAAKIRENLDAEIFQVCLMEAREQRHEILISDACRPANKRTLFSRIRRKK